MCGTAKKVYQSGWTLIELLIVMTIVVVLAGVSLSHVGSQTQPAYRQLMQAEMLLIAQSLEESYSHSLNYQPLELKPFPADSPRYRLSLHIANSGQNFTLQATPLANQQEDGALYLDASGARRIYPKGIGGSYVSW